MENIQERPSRQGVKLPVTHFVWLDWLRFGAAFVVLLVHTRGFSFVEFGALDAVSKTKLTMLCFAFTRIGHEAVIVFFVLSGFLVGGKVIERVGLRSFSWRSYAIDRTSRILVPMVPAIILALAVDTFYGRPPTGINAAGTLLLLQQFGITSVPGINTIVPLWSLVYEVWFYILAGALAVAILRSPRLPRLVIAILFLAIAIFTKLSTVYLFCWSIGALMFLYPRQKFSQREITLSIAFTVLGLAMYEISTASRSIHFSGWISMMGSQSLGELVLSLGIAILIRNLCTIEEDHEGLSFLGNLGEKLAAFSYTLYLVHYPVLTAMQNMGYKAQRSISPQTLGLFILRVIICLAISYGFYWIFERNTPAVRRFMRNRILKGQV